LMFWLTNEASSSSKRRRASSPVIEGKLSTIYCCLISLTVKSSTSDLKVLAMSL
jgi:hypothetical protein